MAKAQFVYEGIGIDHTPSAAVSAGDVVVLGDQVAVARLDIAASALGTLYTTGVYDVVKEATTDTFLANQPVYWDAANERADPEKGILMGFALAAAAATDTTVRVKLEAQNLPPAMQNKIFESVDVSGGSKTLDAQDIGKVMNVTVGHATNVVTLPATAAGVHYVIRCGATGQRVAVSPNANDKIMGADLAGADNKDRILAAADSVAGDYLHLVADGSAGWYVVAERGAWSAEE